MVQPIDLHVLLNRVLELQRLQGVALRQPQDENETFKNRIAQEVIEEERQVRRRKEIVHGRIHEEERSNRGQREPAGEKKRQRSRSPSSERNRKDDRGLIIDFEV